jgi:uncharacterized protein YggU (UPF0235/DUF167 family)
LPPFRERAGGIDLFVRLTPGSSREEIGGLAESADGGSHLIARVRAVPEKGAANLALERLLAERLGVPRGSVSVVAGRTSRLKTVRIAGDAAFLAGRIAEAAGPASKSR